MGQCNLHVACRPRVNSALRCRRWVTFHELLHGDIHEQLRAEQEEKSVDSDLSISRFELHFVRHRLREIVDRSRTGQRDVLPSVER